MAWQPNQDGLRQVVQLFRDSQQPDSAVQQRVYKQLEELKQHPEFCNYLVFVVHRGVNESEDVRLRACIQLKHCLSKSWLNLQPNMKSFIKESLACCIGDQAAYVRKAVASAIATIIHEEGLRNWPGLIELLVKFIEDNNPERVRGGLTVLNGLCEDIPKHLDDEQANRPLNVIIPLLIKFFKHPDATCRRDALNAVNQFLLMMPQALAVNMDKYMQGIFTLTQDPNKAIQKRLCQSFVLLLEVRFDYLSPHMENVIQYMLQASADDNEEVSLEACEFWSAYCATPNADMKLLWKYLPNLIPTLLKGMVYSEDDIAMMPHAYDDDRVPDSEQDIAPHFHQARNAYGADEEDDDDDWDDVSEWNLRKCSAASLDTLASFFHDGILQFLLVPLNKALSDNDWMVRESGILALGAIAEGCFEGLQPHLPTLVPWLMQLLTDREPLVKSITCWTLSRYASWVVKDPDDKKYFLPLLAALLKCVLDPNKKVQEAACSAFATLEEEAQQRLIPYLTPILENLMHACQRYQTRNMFILFHAIGTLAEAVGSALNHGPHIAKLMPPLMQHWNTISDDDRNIFPLLECLTSIAQALRTGFAQYAAPVYARSIQIIQKNLAMQSRAEMLRSQNQPYDLPDKEFMVCALDVLSGLVEGLGPSIQSLIVSQNHAIIKILFECIKDSEADVRQSAFALLGDVAKACIEAFEGHLGHFMPIAAANLDPKHSSVCNNAIWAIGEIAMKVGSKLAPYAPQLMKAFTLIITEKNALNSLRENTAITIGRLGIVCPEAVAPFLKDIASPWCVFLTSIVEDTEKEHAFTGLCRVLQQNPEPMLQCFDLLCVAMLNWRQPKLELVDLFRNILHAYKRDLIGEQRWPEFSKKLPPNVLSALQQIYGL